MEQLTYSDVKKQSQAVFGQFGHTKWIPFAKENAGHPNRRDPEELRGCGVGKILVSVGMGASLEENLDIIKKYRHKFDLICPDKAFKPLVERGVIPDYVMLCDCNIQWPKWGPEGIDTKNIKLIATPYAHVTWTRRWEGPIYFYCNRDAIQSENIFLEIMGGKTRMIPASSNVSNAQVVFFTGMDEWTKQTFAGYERIYLVGYDYSWRPNGNYYAWHDPKPKRYYMHHKTGRDINGDIVYFSENLLFSAKWLMHYVTAHPSGVINCSGRGLSEVKQGNLEAELKSIDESRVVSVRTNLETIKHCKAALDNAIAAFNISREELCYGSRRSS